MKRIQTAALIAAAVLGMAGSALAGEKDYKVEYVGGSLDLKTRTDIKLCILEDSVELHRGGETLVAVPAAGLTVHMGGNGQKPFGISDVGLSVVTLGWGGLIKLSHMKFVSIGLDWAENGKPQTVVLAPKAGEWSQILANLEAATGRKTGL